MLIPGPAVLVPQHLAGPVLELAVAEVRRRDAAGRGVSREILDLLRELAVAARDEPVPTGSDRCADRGRPPIVDGVTTSTAAEQLGISQRAVRKRIAKGRIDGAQQQPDRTWLIPVEALS